MLQSITHFLLLVLCNVRIRSHPLNGQQEQISTLLEGGKLWFSPLIGEGLEPIVLPWKCHRGHIMELFDECNNCAMFQLYTEKVLREIKFFVILHHFVATKWHHKSSNLHKSKSWITQQPRVLSDDNKINAILHHLKALSNKIKKFRFIGTLILALLSRALVQVQYLLHFLFTSQQVFPSTVSESKIKELHH